VIRLSCRTQGYVTRNFPPKQYRSMPDGTFHSPFLSAHFVPLSFFPLSSFTKIVTLQSCQCTHCPLPVTHSTSLASSSVNSIVSVFIPEASYYIRREILIDETAHHYFLLCTTAGLCWKLCPMLGQRPHLLEELGMVSRHYSGRPLVLFANPSWIEIVALRCADL